jgi:predicted porin
MGIKKILRNSSLLITLITSSLSTHALSIKTSGNTELDLDVLYVSQAGYTTQDLKGVDKNISDNKDKFAFYSEASFGFTIKSISDNGVITGAKIVLLPTTFVKTSPSWTGSYVFMETDYGKVELGSPADAGSKMRISAYNAMAAGSASWSKYGKLNNSDMEHLNIAPEFDVAGGFYLDSFVGKFSRTTDKTEQSRKISFYTPELQGFQIGISYIPDTGNFGSSSINNIDKLSGESRGSTAVSSYKIGDKTWIINRHLTNAVSGGISYKYDISDKAAIKLSLTGEYGKPVHGIRVTNTDTKVETAKYALSDLKAYNIGAHLTYGNFSYAVSYGSLGDSLTSPEFHKVSRDTYFYNGSIAYKQGPIKTSIAYFKSSKYSNELDAVTLGTEYAVSKGFVPYAEVSYFSATGKNVTDVTSPEKKTNGFVTVLGTKFKL